MVSTGTFSDPYKVVGFVYEFVTPAVTANLYLARFISPCRLDLGGMQFWADTADVGAGNTVIDVFINGTSIWTTAGQRPTLASAATGGFTLTRPPTRSVNKSDRLDIQVVTIPATTGHANVRASIALENAVAPY